MLCNMQVATFLFTQQLLMNDAKTNSFKIRRLQFFSNKVLKHAAINEKHLKMSVICGGYEKIFFCIITRPIHGVGLGSS